jgi:hypothetical protein
MKIPWRFIVALPLGFILAIALFVGALYTQLGVPTHMSQWVSDLWQKKENVAARISGPRLLLVGGSGALFGINAQLIQQETGKPTVNMGTHAALMLNYIFYRIEKDARPGDTVLLVCEYEYYLNRFTYSQEISDDYILARDPAYFRAMPLADKIAMATRIPFKRLQTGWKNRPDHARPPSPPYSPYTPITPGIDCLDDNGDEIFNTEAARPPPQAFMQQPVKLLRDGFSSENTDGFADLTAFLQWARAHHVTVLATFPNLIYQPVYDLPKAQKTLETITRFYTSHGVPVIGTPREAMLPTDQFFDSVYHLVHSAALQRTERLIPELRPYLSPTP